MRHLLNTLFVTSEDAWLSLDGENVVVNREKAEVARFPLHNLQGIVCFSYSGASPALMGACAQRDVALTFCTPRGKFLARTSGISRGNVLLRRTQYRIADDPRESCAIAKSMIFGKVYNARWSIERTRRDHKMRIDEEKFLAVSESLKATLPQILEAEDAQSLRALEGAAANRYFQVFDDMLLREKDAFFFHGRNRRPPLDNVKFSGSTSCGTSEGAIVAHRSIMSMQCFRLLTVCLRTTALLRLKAWDWMPTSDFCTPTVPGGHPWHST